jgi:hypothetical protein
MPPATVINLGGGGGGSGGQALSLPVDYDGPDGTDGGLWNP